MNPDRLATLFVESLTKNDSLRNRYKQADEPTQRRILTAWYEGVSAARTVDVPSINAFLDAAIPHVKKAVAA